MNKCDETNPISILAQDMVEEFLSEDDPPGVKKELEDPTAPLIELAATALARAILESPDSVLPVDVTRVATERAYTIVRRWIEEDYPQPSLKIVWNADK